MTTVSGDVRVRFHGFGSGGTAYEFTLNQPETSTSFPILLEPPSIPSSSIAPLDPSSSSSSLSVRLGYEAGSSAARAAVRELIAVDRLPLTDGAGRLCADDGDGSLRRNALSAVGRVGACRTVTTSR